LREVIDLPQATVSPVAATSSRAGRAPGSREVAPASRSLLGWPVLTGVLVLIGLAFAVQSLAWETNGDTSWLITVIDRLHAGDRLFVDIIEVNPPASVWLYLAPVQLSYLTGISPEILVRAYALLILAGGVAATGWIARDGQLMPDRALPPALAGLFAATTGLVGTSFSERDQIGVVLLTPLVALAAWRAIGGSPGPRHWLIAGVAGGVIALVKPYYAIVVLTAAAFVVVRRRDARLFLLPEFLIAGAMSLAYLAAFYVAYPVYFEQFLPLLRDTYMAFSWPLSTLALSASPWLAVPLAYWLFARRDGRTAFADALFVCAIAAWIPYFVQGKGWAYHAYPATYLGSAALIATAAALLSGPPKSAARRDRSAEILGIALVAIVAAHVRFFENAAPSSDLAKAVREHATAPTVGMLGGDIAAGHPLTRMIGGRWIELYCSDWIPVYALRLEQQMQDGGDTRRAGYYRHMYDRYLADKLARVTDSPPEVLIVDEDDFLVSMMLAEPGYAALLSRYSKVASDRRFAVYRLVDPVATSPAGSLLRPARPVVRIGPSDWRSRVSSLRD
jgi:hypothetical protein